MGLFSRLTRIASRAGRRLFSSTSTGLTWKGFAKLIGGGNRSSAGVKVSTKSMLGYPALWRGVNLICDGTRKCNIHLYRKTPNGSRERQTDHESYKRMRRKANKLLTSGIFRQVMTFHAIIWGNAYAAIVRDNAGRVRELLILDPAKTFPVIARGELWYVTEIDGEQVKRIAEDVFHLRRLSRDGLLGLSLVDLFKESIGLGLAARGFGSHFFGQGAKASGILMIPGHIKKEAQINLVKAFDSMVSKLTKSHKVALIQDGAKFEQLTIPPEQGQFLQTRQFENREIALILGVPPHKVGDMTRQGYNSLEQEDRNWLSDGLDPHFVMWEEECNDKLLTEDEKESDEFYFRFNREELLQMNLKDRAEAFAKIFEHGGATANDWNRWQDLPLIPGPEGDMRFRPSNLVPLDHKPEPKPAPAPPGEKPPANPADDEELDDDEADAEEKAQQRKEERRARARAIKAAHYRVILERFEGALKIECAEVQAAANREPNFLEWCERFYGRHAERLSAGLWPIFAAYYSLTRKNAQQVEHIVRSFVESHCDRQRAALINAADVPRKEFPAKVAELVQEWTDGRQAYQSLDDWALSARIYIDNGGRSHAA